MVFVLWRADNIPAVAKEHFFKKFVSCECFNWTLSSH